MSREAWIVVDLGFGDAGKGATTDFLVRARQADLVVRWHGGAQAGHTVVTDDRRSHTFSQLGAGAFAGVPALLGPAFVFHPLALAVEAQHLGQRGVADPWAGVAIHASAPVITPFQQAAGRLRERLRGADAHGTCGVGVGERVSDGLLHPDDAVRAGDLRDPAVVERRLRAQMERKRAEMRALGGRGTDLRPFDDPGLPAHIAQIWRDTLGALEILDPDPWNARLDGASRVVFEGAQGVLLDETWGFHPHTTWSDCTPAVARQLAGDRPTTTLGVLRAFGVRHGPGPFPGELQGDPRLPPEPHNGDDGWQGRFRRGALDGVLLRYALEVCGGVDGLALTWLDAVPRGPAVDAYDGPAPEGLARTDASGRVRALEPGRADDLGHRERLGAWLKGVRPTAVDVDPARFVEEAGGVPVVLRSTGPSWRDRTLRATGR